MKIYFWRKVGYMSVVICPNCGLRVSDYEGKCFACGARLPKPTVLSDEKELNSTFETSELSVMNHEETVIDEVNKCSKKKDVSLNDDAIDKVTLDSKDNNKTIAEARSKEYFKMQKHKEAKIKKERERKAHSTLSIISLVFAFIFFPLGIFLGVKDILKGKKSERHIFSVIALIIAGIIFLVLYASSSDSSESRENSNTIKSAEEYEEKDEGIENYEKQEIQEDMSETVEKPELDCSDELAIFEGDEYKYITEDDLARYYPNLGGELFYTVAQINKVREDMVQITISDGYMMSDFYTERNYSEYISSEDTVAILGVVGNGSNDYGIMGKSYVFDNCAIFAYGNDAKKYEKSTSDPYFEQFFTLSDEVANNIGSDNLDEEEFKGLCQEYEYEEILRNPDEHKNKYCVVSGSVSQIIEGLLGSFTIYIEDTNGNKWGCTYRYKEGEAHVLEDDWITVYGILNGTETTKTVLGKQVTMPFMDIKYIESSTIFDDGMTMGQKNAIKSAKSYLSYSAYSREGLIDQLSSEYGEAYSVDDATYAVNYLEDNNLVDWYEQAVKSAESYLSFSSYSREGLINQLTSEYGEKFTTEQAEYAVSELGC